jgi:hypothetical protein
MVSDQDQNCASHRHNQTVQINAADAPHPEEAENQAAQDGTHDAEQDIEHETLSAPIYDFAGDEASDQSQDDPS